MKLIAFFLNSRRPACLLLSCNLGKPGANQCKKGKLDRNSLKRSKQIKKMMFSN
jgi:hypothetical protein